ncbi:MAG: hypothetical protein WBE55_22150 [Candidatus Sulfotelmatobacter sp.]
MANDTTPRHPSGGVIKIENDYRNTPGRWNGQDVTKRAPALTAARLDEIRAKAPKPLPTFAERQREAQRTGVTVKPSVVVIGKNGTEKLQ